jgi:uncharacterized protein (TIGR02453 family)
MNMKDIMFFLADLRRNNTRDWFQANRKRYESCRDEYLDIVQSVIHAVSGFDLRLNDLKARDALFRINRDIRFSNDKSPYKTHFGAYMARGGRKSPEAGYYMHVSPDEVFIAAGSYSPEKERLKVIRQEILFQPESYMGIVESMKEKGFVPMSEDRLKTAPKDFPRESPYIDLVRDKHYIVSRVLTAEEIGSDDFPLVAGNLFRKTFPYVAFLNEAMEFIGNE